MYLFTHSLLKSIWTDTQKPNHVSKLLNFLINRINI